MRRNTPLSTKLWKKRQKVTPISSAAHDGAAELSPAQQLGSLGGAARARNLTAEQRRKIAQKAAAKRWERSDLPQAAPSNSSDKNLSGRTAAGYDHAAALIVRNHRLLPEAEDVRLRSEAVIARSEAVGRAMTRDGTVVAPCSSRVAWRSRQ